MKCMALGSAAVAIMMVAMIPLPAVAEQPARYVIDFSEGMIPIWKQDGKQAGAVDGTTFGAQSLPIQEERNGYYLVEHPDEGLVFVPAYAVELDRSITSSPVPCNLVGSFETRSTSGLGAGEGCSR
jgi:hypothetical protein